ncbi:MAG: hypothetical protein ACYDHH_30750 [Solirubrobacteraceae bacterium]
MARCIDDDWEPVNASADDIREPLERLTQTLERIHGLDLSDPDEELPERGERLFEAET